MAKARRSPWSNLPSDLLHKISFHHLHTHLDFLRFSAACSSWRRSSAPPRRSLLPSKLPFPLHPPDSLQPSHGYYRLTLTIVYRLQPLHPPSPSSPLPRLVKLEEDEHGSRKFRLLSPVLDSQIKNVGLTINVRDFRFVEVSKGYYLKYFNHAQKRTQTVKESVDPKKVLFFLGVDDDEYSIVALNGDNSLYYVKRGDEEWTQFDFGIEDIVDYNGSLHSLDFSGNTFVYDSSYGNRSLISSQLSLAMLAKRF